MENLSLSEKPSGGEEANIHSKCACDVANGEENDKREDHDTSVGDDAAANSPSKKKRKPKKKAKKLIAPPSVQAAEESLPWSLASSARLGRHAVAKRAISPGDLVLVEAPVAAVVRSQYVKSVCHTCFRELPKLGPAGMQPQKESDQPYKQYCSCACALADDFAGVTMSVHAKIDDLAIKTQVDPQLLRLILELDSKRATSAPAVKPHRTPEGTWVLEIDSSVSSEPKTSKPACNGSPAEGSQKQSGGDKSITKEAPVDTAGSAAAASNGASEHPPEAHVNGNGSPKRAVGKAEGLGALRCKLEDVETLSGHWDKSPEGWRKSVRAGCESLRQTILSDGRYQPGSLQQFLDLAAIINNNAHGVGAANSANTDSALGLYPALSMLNHSCLPNCVFASCGTDMQVRAIRPVAAGEQLTVAYINLMEPRSIRARLLMETKHFACACERCSAPLETHPDRFLEAVRCTASGCESGWLLEQRADDLSEGDTWRCVGGCGAAVPARSATGPTGPLDVSDSFRNDWQHAANMLRYKGHVAARPAFESVLAAADARLHPMHVIAFDSLMPLVNCCRQAGDGAGAIKHLSRMLDTMDAICGLPTVEVGNLYDLLGKLYADRAGSAPAALRARAKKQARDAWARALSAWTVSLGEHNERCTELSSRMKLLR
ncbi:probable histone-lysine N-methyltransferase Smyd1 at C-terminar half [Coccomyxa sp. Obi]|nr:probable histone-lysine N-methyltransferase Smyd1 at C-terminar half [Coccomyxa sp. Obi]